MRIDLQTARVRPVGSSGIAHRTGAGFVMLGTADSRNVLSIIEENAVQPNLVELVVAELSVAAPEAFCFLFVSQSELYVLTCGAAVISLTTATGHSIIEPQPQQVLIQRLDLGMGDSDGRLVLFQKGMTVEQVDGLDSVVDLQSGTVLADALDLTIRRTATPAAAPAAATAAAPGSAITPASAPEAVPFAASPPAPASDFTHQPVSPPALDVPVAPVAVTPPAAAPLVPSAGSSLPPAPPPAADQIRFAEDLAEPVSVGAIGAMATAAVATSVPTAPPELTAQPVSTGAFSGVLSQQEPVAAAAVAESNGITAVAAPAPQRTVGPVMVLGVACPDGHHNHPDATECSECAARIGEHHTTVLMNGPRPPLGMLMVDDGKTWSLASDIIIGREPTTHEDVAAGTADSMALSDDTLSLSRHHARISLEDWSAYVIDLGSSNGSFLNRNRSSQEWSPVPTDMALELEPGDRLRVGSRIIQIELYQFEQ